MLAQAGILEADSSGFRLPSFSRSDMEEVFEIRMLIEPYAIRLSSEKTSDKDLERTFGLINAELEAYYAASTILYGPAKLIVAQ